MWRSLRSIQGLDARHTILETMAPQTGNIIVHYLHLPPSKSRVLVQVELVIGAVLQEGGTDAESENRTETCFVIERRCCVERSPTTLRGLRDRRE